MMIAGPLVRVAHLRPSFDGPPNPPRPMNDGLIGRFTCGPIHEQI